MLFLLVYNITMIHKYNRLKNRFEICLIHLAPPYKYLYININMKWIIYNLKYSNFVL